MTAAVHRIEVFGLTRPGQMHALCGPCADAYLTRLRTADTDFYEVLPAPAGASCERCTLTVRVDAVNDAGAHRTTHGHGATTDAAVASALDALRRSTGDGTWTMNDWWAT